jgi:hypothetical protein
MKLVGWLMGWILLLLQCLEWIYTRAVWQVRRLSLLLRVGTSWRCGDGLFFEVPPLASDALLTTLHLLLGYVLQTVSISKFLASELPFHVWESQEIAWSEIWTVWQMFLCSTDPLFPSWTQNSIQISSHVISGLFQPWKGNSEACNFEISTVCSIFSRSGWSVVRSASLVKGGTWKKRPSLYLHKFPTRRNKAIPRTLQTALVQWQAFVLMVSNRRFLIALWCCFFSFNYHR